MNISIAIADSNKDYIERLSEVLQQYDELTISVYTSAEKLLNAMENNRFDVVLFDPDLSDERILFSRVKLPVCLYSDEARYTSLYSDIEKVAKYQRISSIYKQVLRSYAEKAGYSAEFDHSQNTSIVAVYSPIGGCGKTTVALDLGSNLVSQGKSVLFLGAEQLNSSSCMNPHQEDGIVSLAEAASSEHVNFELKMKGIMKPGLNGMFYLEGFERYADYDAVDEEEMILIMEKIRKSGIFDIVLVDLGSGLHVVEKAVMRSADKVLIVEKPGELPAAKMTFFYNQAEFHEFKNKILWIYNFAESNSTYSNRADVPVAGTIHNYGNLQLKSIIHAIQKNREITTDKITRR